MSAQKNFLTFSVDLSDDVEFSESGDILVPRGRGVCLIIMQFLRKIGVNVSGPSQYDYYGWKFNGTIGGSQFWFLLQDAQPWLLISEDRTGLIGRWRPGRYFLADLLERLNVEVCADVRFEDVKWFSKVEYESGVDIKSRFL